MKQLPRCKYCGALPVRGQFGKIYETYCPEMDTRKCKAPPQVEAETRAQADQLWIDRFGVK